MLLFIYQEDTSLAYFALSSHPFNRTLVAISGINRNDRFPFFALFCSGIDYAFAIDIDSNPIVGEDVVVGRYYDISIAIVI